MIAQAFRWLIVAALIAAVLLAIFVAWWLALLIAFAALALGTLRRLFGSKLPERRPGSAVILEGEHIEVERETSRKLRDREDPGA